MNRIQDQMSLDFCSDIQMIRSNKMKARIHLALHQWFRLVVVLGFTHSFCYFHELPVARKALYQFL